MKIIVPGRFRNRTGSGYALLDVVLATTVFAIWGTGLVALLQNISETSGSYSRDRLIQYQLESLITEAKHKPIQEVTGEFLDEVLAVTYTTTLEPLELGNVDGNALENLYRLTVTATWQEGAEPQNEIAEVYLHKPAEEAQR